MYIYCNICNVSDIPLYIYVIPCTWDYMGYKWGYSGIQSFYRMLCFLTFPIHIKHPQNHGLVGDAITTSIDIHRLTPQVVWGKEC
jgi:hypothetical protein